MGGFSQQDHILLRLRFTTFLFQIFLKVPLNPHCTHLHLITFTEPLLELHYLNPLSYHFNLLFPLNSYLHPLNKLKAQPS